MIRLHSAASGAVTAALIASSLIAAPALATPGSNFGPPALIVNGHFGKIQVNTSSDKTDK